MELYMEALSRWFFISAYSPKKNFFVATLQNITERKQTEKNFEDAKIAARNVYEDLQVEKGKLSEAKAKDDVLLENIGEGVVAVDQDGKITMMNKVAQNLLGFAARELIGKSFVQTVVVEDERGGVVPAPRHPIIGVLTEGKTTTTTTTCFFVRKDGIKFPGAMTTSRLLLGTERIGAIVVFRDITKEKEIDRAKTEFVSLASHQLRTPITSIRWYAEMLLKNDVGTLAPDQKKYVTEIYKSDRRMIELVNALLNISRIELGTLALHPETVAVGELFQEMERDFAQQIGEKGITFTYEYPPDNAPIKMDRQLLKIVLQNLFANAVEYTLAAGLISIRVEHMDGAIHIALTDSGCGIPPGAQEKIFTKFFRADNARTLKPDGSGLGLYMTKSIVEALDGTIRFVSQPGKTTTFFVSIPELLVKKEGISLIS
jgi:PAS domain S-box-containing protein